MALNYLDCFVSLAKHLSFTATAKEMGITQPSVSRQIRLLEEQLGVQLFRRDRQAVQLTPAGKELRAEITPMLEGIRATLETSREKSRKIEGSLAFSCLPEIGQYYFMHHLLEFQAQHPQIDLHVRYCLEPEIIAGLKNGEIDLGVITQPLISESIRSYRLIDEHPVLVTRTQNQRPFTDPAEAHFVGYERTDALLADFLKKTFKPSQVSKIRRLSTVNSYKSILETLLARDCYAVLPFFGVRELVETKRLKIVSQRDVRHPLYLIYLESNHASLKNEAFRKFLIQKCKSEQLE
ncbi:MAG: LysR family transcriptional regulator [Bacteriovoracia bacterium]